MNAPSLDVRWIASTHRDLAELVATGAFRQDLYERLNAACITVPPLRERVDEIPRLANELVGRFCKESKRAMLSISDAAIAVLKTHPWPGNVSELRDVIDRAVRACKAITLAPEHLELPRNRASRPPSGKMPRRHPDAVGKSGLAESADAGASGSGSSAPDDGPAGVVRDEIDRET
jgi:DNA-binding NtrC family response regulator